VKSIRNLKLAMKVGFMALALFVFVAGVCLESLRNHDHKETSGTAHSEAPSRQLAPASDG